MLHGCESIDQEHTSSVVYSLVGVAFLYLRLAFSVKVRGSSCSNMNKMIVTGNLNLRQVTVQDTHVFLGQAIKLLCIGFLHACLLRCSVLGHAARGVRKRNDPSPCKLEVTPYWKRSTDERSTQHPRQ